MSPLRWSLQIAALGCAVASLTQRWTEQAFAVKDTVVTNQFSEAGVLNLLNTYAIPEQPPESAGVVIVKVVAILVTIGAVVVLRSGRSGRLTPVAAFAVTPIAAAASLHVLSSDTLVRGDGLLWLWGASIALSLLAAANVAACPQRG